VLAARRAGIHRVILPKGNEKDLSDIPDHIRSEMEFILAERIEEVLATAIPQLAERLAEPASVA
jgi:ATP-dependent Lon protease